MDVDAQATSRRNNGQSSPQPARALPEGIQRSARAMSVEMADAPNNSGTSEVDAQPSGMLHG